jgi:hypothetical protein
LLHSLGLYEPLDGTVDHGIETTRKVMTPPAFDQPITLLPLELPLARPDCHGAHIKLTSAIRCRGGYGHRRPLLELTNMFAMVSALLAKLTCGEHLRSFE